ncbi:MAG: YrbL family protein [Pseudoxanthomonas sp.]
MESWNHMAVIGRGANRICVVDRRDGGRCLKFMLPPRERTRVGLRQRLRRSLAARSGRDENHAEMQAWLWLSQRVPGEELDRHVATCLGLLPTAWGRALCCRRVCDAQGRTAPSLNDLLAGGSRWDAPALCAAVDRFERWLLQYRIPLFDLNGGNLRVLDDGGAPRLVCVDVKSVLAGKEILPLSRRIPVLRRRKLRRRAERLRLRIAQALPAAVAPASPDH